MPIDVSMHGPDAIDECNEGPIDHSLSVPTPRAHLSSRRALNALLLLLLLLWVYLKCCPRRLFVAEGWHSQTFHRLLSVAGLQVVDERVLRVLDHFVDVLVGVERGAVHVFAPPSCSRVGVQILVVFLQYLAKSYRCVCVWVFGQVCLMCVCVIQNTIYVC